MSRLLQYVNSAWQVAVVGISGPNITGAGKNAAPTAFFTVTYDGATVYFNASGSTGGDGTITNYHWDYGNGTQTDDDSSSQYTYAITGDFIATLTVTSSLNLVSQFSMTVSPTVPGSSGQPMPVGDLPGWKQIIAQDFSTPAALGSFASVYPNWATYDTYQDTSRNTNRPANQIGVYNSVTTTTVHDSMFDAHLFTNSSGTPQVMALTPPNQSGTGLNYQTYGRYSVRFKIDNMPGYKIAWLLWPFDDNWNNGEIDYPEGALDSTISAYSHDVTGTPSNNAYALDLSTSVYGAWHTATTEWTANKITFYLDGAVVGSTTTPAALPSHPMRWVLQIETRITDAPPDPAVDGHVLIDWVTSYQYSPAVTGPPPPSPTVPRFSHIIDVWMENHSETQIIGNTAQAPYINTLAAQNAYFTNAQGVAHPSEPNYLAAFSGSTQNVTDDGSYNFGNLPNLYTQLTNAGLTFKGYFEGTPERKHAPWESFSNTQGAEAAFSTFPTDYTNLPRVCWVVPNAQDNMHDGTIAQGDAWLKTHIDPVIQWAKNNNSLVIIRWDEDDDNSANGNDIPVIFAGAHVSPGAYSTAINHYTVLGMVEDSCGLTRLGNAASEATLLAPWSAPTTATTTAATSANAALTATGSVRGALTATANANAALTATASAQGAPVARVQYGIANAAYSGGTTFTSQAVSLPGAAKAGNLLIAAWSVDKVSGTFTTPTGWTALVGRSNAAVSMLVAYKVAAGGETSVTGTWATGSFGCSALVAEYSNVSSTPFGPNDLSVYNGDGTETAHTSLAFAPATPTSNGLAVALIGIDTVSTSTGFNVTATGYTRVSTSTFSVGSGSPGLALSEKALAAGTANTPTFTWTDSDQVQGVLLQIKQVGT